MRYLLLLALWAFVYSANGVTLEQARQNPLQAYVLTNQQGQIMSNSGVRLGPIDFSVETPQSLASYGVPQNLISRFQPYFGKTGAQAQQALNQQPLTISQQDFNLIQQKFIAFWANQARTLPASIKQTPAARRVAMLALNRQWPDLLEALASARMAIRTTP